MCMFVFVTHRYRMGNYGGHVGEGRKRSRGYETEKEKVYLKKVYKCIKKINMISWGQEINANKNFCVDN